MFNILTRDVQENPHHFFGGAWRVLVCTLAISIPLSAVAQTVTDVNSFIQWLLQFFNYVYYLLMTLVLVVFFWGLARFILSAGDERGRTNGRSMMLWGIVGIFVLVSLWAIVYFFTGSLGLDGGTPCYVNKDGQIVGGGNCGV